MPLDAEALVLLQRLAGSRPLREQTAAEARRNAYRLADHFGAPEPVANVEHRFISAPTADLPVRLHTPVVSQAGEELPALVYFHGSGFVVSNIGVFDAPSRALANRTGCKVVAVNYQKAPEHRFPVPFDDAYASTAWVVEHAGGLAVDPRRVGVIGDSAGGTLAAAVCLKARDVGGPPIAAQILVHAPLAYDPPTPSMSENGRGLFLEAEDMRWFYDQYLARPEDAAVPYAVPLASENLAGLPPALVVTAEYDPLRDEGEAYGRRLQEAGVDARVRRYAGMIHGFYGMVASLRAADELFDEIAAFVRQGMPSDEGLSGGVPADRARRDR